MGMDINIIKYINDNFNTLSLEPVFIAKNKFNVPEYLYNNLNKTAQYLFNTLDVHDLSHSYISRVYNGNLHDRESCIRFTKSINVKVSADENLTYDKKDESSHLSFKYIRLRKNDRRQSYKIYDAVYSMVHKFMMGDVAPDDVMSTPVYSDEINLHYTIGPVTILQSEPDSNDMVSCFIAIPYKVESTFITSNEKIG